MMESTVPSRTAVPGVEEEDVGTAAGSAGRAEPHTATRKIKIRIRMMNRRNLGAPSFRAFRERVGIFSAPDLE